MLVGSLLQLRAAISLLPDLILQPGCARLQLLLAVPCLGQVLLGFQCALAEALYLTSLAGLGLAQAFETRFRVRNPRLGLHQIRPAVLLPGPVLSHGRFVPGTLRILRGKPLPGRVQVAFQLGNAASLLGGS